MKRKCLILTILFLLVLSMTLPVSAASLTRFATARFDQSFPVYSGPGTHYFRANNGKATYGGGGVARVYGLEGSWLLIGYEMGSGDYRIGYIDDAALNYIYDIKGEINYNLVLDSYTAYTNANCNLTDDPIINNKPILSLGSGTQVTVLATMGTEWTFVELMGYSSLMRGFVRSRFITTSGSSSSTNSFQSTYAPNTYYHIPNKGSGLPQWQTVYFQGAQEVYSGPGTYYYRANQGRATMGGGLCRLYGVENGWAMIGYELSNGLFRIGYVPQSAIPEEGLSIPYLDLICDYGELTSDTFITDDIVIRVTAVQNLPRGTSVTVLGYTNGLVYGQSSLWAYVEVTGSTYLMRGFVPAAAVGY